MQLPESLFPSSPEVLASVMRIPVTAVGRGQLSHEVVSSAEGAERCGEKGAPRAPPRKLGPGRWAGLHLALSCYVSAPRLERPWPTSRFNGF